MKRKPKWIPHRRDRNLENVRTAGQAARLNDKPLTACPNLIPVFGERYAVELMQSWMEGWYAADRKLRSPELPLGGGRER